jgi:hypothetical protein
MATIGNTYIQLIDALKAGDMARAVVVNALRKISPVKADANVITCNQGTKHKHMVLTGLPTAAWTALYEGIPQSKAGYTQVEDTTGMLQGRSSVDTRLLDISKDPEAIRMMYATPHLETMVQEFEKTFFYSDVSVNGRKFHGMAPRYSSLTQGKASSQIIDGGGTGSDNTSIWFVTWGDHATSLITPEGIPAGVQREDKGEQRTLDENLNPYYVKEEIFTDHVGTAVADWRYNARVANIDVSDINTVDVNDLMISAYYKLQGTRTYDRSTGDPQFDMGSTGRTVIYMNRTVMARLDRQSRDPNKGVRLTESEGIDGQMLTTWRGLPIRETDSILNTEARVL